MKAKVCDICLKQIDPPYYVLRGQLFESFEAKAWKQRLSIDVCGYCWDSVINSLNGLGMAE